jgi:hypothetical protein
MAKQESINLTIKYYEDEKFVTLPLDFNIFIMNICNMLSIPQEKKENFQFSYQNESDLKIYFIKNEEDYNLLLKICKEQKTKVLNIQLSNDFEDKKIEIIKNKEDNANINNINNIIQINNDNTNKNNSENIPINIDENLEAMEFSYLNADNNIIEKNNNKNNNQINNNINNNQINEQNNPSELNKNFNINCSICNQNKFTDIVYYCSDCKLFFCDKCEIDIGKIHKHCYYKIRNKKQYNELKDSLNSFGNKFQNLNKNINKSIINTGNTIENSVKGIFSEGSKIIGNIGNTIKNFFNSNENDANKNKNNNNNDINSNELNNPYEVKNEQKQENKDKNNLNQNQIKSLVMQAKSLYNLSKFNDMEIEKALIQHKGNIEEAVSMLLLDNNF